MSVEISEFGRLRDGRKVKQITLKNAEGTSVCVLDYGATIRSFLFGNTDITLGYDRIEDYENAKGSYIGATIGRVCNRIADGHFFIGRKEIQLACNSGNNDVHLHGGKCGFDKKIWDYEIVEEKDSPSVRFSLFSPDGEENYPGNLKVSVTFTLFSDNTLELAYEAETDKDTAVNLTNHTYFNIGGYENGDVLGTVLHINSDKITEVDERLIPTGKHMKVDRTPLDFRVPKTIGEAVLESHPQLDIAGGVDHNYVLPENGRKLQRAADAYSPLTGIKLTCDTDLPGIQVYTGNFLDEDAGKKNVKWKKRYGFCFETQFFPDSVNHANFPSVILHKGEKYSSLTRFNVSK